jgi:phosphatidylinositol 4-kinase
MIEVLDDELSLENGFKSSLSKIKKHKRGSQRFSVGSKKKQFIEYDDDAADIGDLGSPTSSRSMDLISSTSTSIISTAAAETHHNTHRTDMMIEEPGNLNEKGVNDNYLLDNEHENTFDAEEFAEKMKTAAILLAQLQLDHPSQQDNVTIRASTEGIRQKIIAEMMALEDDRMEKMALEGVDKGVGGGGGGECAGNERKLDDEMRVAMVANKEDPSAAVFSEDWNAKKERIRAASPYGHLPNWRLISVIVKNGADLRQEQFAIQLIREMQKIWQDTKTDVWVQ